MKKAVFKDILNAEQQIELETYDKYGKFFILFDECMNALINLIYLDVNIPDNIESDEYAFYFYIKESYAHAPFSIRSITILMAKGQYQEALNLCRSTIENLVNCKYLFTHKEQAKKTLAGDYFKIKDRWDEIVGTEAYKEIYKFLCKIEHKNFGYGNSQPRINATFLNEKGHSLVPSFERIQAEVIINYLVFLMYGYLNLYPLFFMEFENQNSDLLNRLDEILAQNKDLFPKKERWHLIMQKIVSRKD